jgi:hypothetical protein
VQKSDSIKELSTALSKAQAAFKPVPMNAINPFLKNHYADLGSVIESAKPVLAAHGLSISQLVENDGPMIGVTTILMHQSGEWLLSTMTLPMLDEKGKSAAQVAGSIITYIRRYAYGAIIGLYTGDDDDGNGKTPTPPSAQKPQTQPAAQQQPQAQHGDGYCVIHSCEMRQHEKDGKKWYSHKLDDGAYCNGKTTRPAATK